MTKFKIIVFSGKGEKHLSFAVYIDEADEDLACDLFDDQYSSVVDQLKSDGYIVDIEIKRV